ncbi:hypothetical protein IWW36_000801 [Coemansia brasiliensis]|uniref:Dihydrolipoamide acetyltransferase component of pyruvate dehydrogenase complex n=1 Tax=Coemansia brasiliensis TaxID=2650707 RepID=A0A9W8M2M3_9FUNG|nr:hypothetical protein IWW36_000801 [Coemansia brasiliensis]
MLGRVAILGRTVRKASTLHRACFHAGNVAADASAFTMPALSPTMTQGGIAHWEKKEGDSFSAGDLLLQIETDKAQMDVEAQDDGVLVKILAPDGTQNVAVNSAIAIIAEEGDDISSIDIDALVSKQQQPAAAPAEVPLPEKKPQKSDDSSSKQVQSKDTRRSTEILQSPAAVFTIHANHIANANEIEGTGPKGRVLKGDVLRFLKDGKAVLSPKKDSTASSQPPAAASNVATKSPAPASKAPANDATEFLVQSLEPSVLRHLAELELAKQSTTVQVAADKLLKLIKGNKNLSMDAFVLRAASLALHQVATKGSNMQVGVAVESGSKAPVVTEVPDASTMSVLDLSAAVKEARKNGQAASETPAVVLAAEGMYSPSTLPNASVVVVSAPYAAVSAADASAALDDALNELIGSSSNVSAGSQQKKKSGSVIDVRIISNSPTAASLATKIKGFLANPELLTF